ncbi:MAG: hypothetical protein MK171_11175 [Pirellulales bacterium]|nr:hypothetical protein [Pirellulales bacterium]
MMRSLPVSLSHVLMISMLWVCATQTQAQLLPLPAVSPVGNVEQAGGSIPAGDAAGSTWQASWWKVTLPKITMPTMTMPTMTMPKIAMPDMSKIFRPVTSGFHEVVTGSKKVWEGTKQMFAFRGGGANGASTPREQAEPKSSFWGRLLNWSAEPAAPQTVGEWMSQSRVDY